MLSDGTEGKIHFTKTDLYLPLFIPQEKCTELPQLSQLSPVCGDWPTRRTRATSTLSDYD